MAGGVVGMDDDMLREGEAGGKEELEGKRRREERVSAVCGREGGVCGGRLTGNGLGDGWI